MDELHLGLLPGPSVKNLPALAALTLTLAACHEQTLSVACSTDSDCPAHFRCSASGQFQGRCLCADDQACTQDTDAGPLICNPQGFCQSKVGCFTDSDCPAPQVCACGICVQAPGCCSDIDCPIGQICPAQTHLCTPGCRSNGDCPLGDGGAVVACVCPGGVECHCPPTGGGFVDPASYDRSLCPIGRCDPTTCAGDTSVCPYDQSCLGSTIDGGRSTCETDPRMNILCQSCTLATPGQLQACGTQGANFCLVDPEDSTGNLTYCGIDCSQGQSCPSGYDCDDVIILTQALCTTNSSCAPTGGPCDITQPDAGCPVDAVCAVRPGETQGRCSGFCVKEEGNSAGFCTCVTNKDCPRDQCDTSTRTCTISQQPCDPTNPATCNAIVSCVDFGGARGCWIGRNCAPGHGLHCPLCTGGDCQQR